MAQRNQRGWLKKESRAREETWVLFFRITRKSDGKRVENKIPIGLVKEFSKKSDAWSEVERLHLPPEKSGFAAGASPSAIWRNTTLNIKLTLQFYTHAVSRGRMAAAGRMITAILSRADDQSGPEQLHRGKFFSISELRRRRY